MNKLEIDFFEQHGYQFIKTIARGGFGVVFLVYSQSYDQYFAVKKIPKENFNCAEIHCLIEINDPKVCNLYQYFKFSDHYYLLMEYCDTDLAQKLKQVEKLTEEATRRLVHDVIACLKVCHDRNIVHVDIKPSNFLFDNYGRVKLCDFGLSKMYQDLPSSYTFHGTKHFMAPEIFQHRQFNPIIADIWALGVTIYYMVTQQYPFQAQDEKFLQFNIEKGKYNADLVQNSLLRDLIARCLEKNPQKRATVDELLEMPYFQNSTPTLRDMRRSDLILKPKIPSVKSNYISRSTLASVPINYNRLRLKNNNARYSANLI
ncbi:CAMK family protein kinase [Trichomonas vaginalis G3]|uniref:CAMK family protein kinase n=1 Tax=Trichomonas vaginalis (strain ATCC PRA-98 / G3) TaxID=412133 RepID=A2EB12_TRIV3|nr:protein serine/threonine kinase protein [Trichomonas vaginalis G3]EAY10152.1 CAMK family protein kinase [Trichomonas vaginalis G3]KAI5534473.1 protein serine/threonine kinase protein [Trichomonas vaginalis G3]|eukprot:XP_001322375.1 CAMK family protein kinase [Trichomonas vaginalis G3]